VKPEEVFQVLDERFGTPGLRDKDKKP